MKAQNQIGLFQVAEVEVSYRPRFKAAERVKVSSSLQAYQILISNWDMDKIEFNERFCILLMNRANRVLGMAEVSSGGVAGTVVDPKIVFSIALKSLASYMILVHNHPSGNLVPSAADLALTRNLAEIGRMLDVLVVDHIILGKDGYYSFGDQGLL